MGSGMDAGMVSILRDPKEVADSEMETPRDRYCG